MKIRKKQNNLENMSATRIILNASAVFILFFVLLFSVFASAAKLSLSNKVVLRPTVATGSKYKITVPKSFNDQLKYAEICRGKIRRACTMVAKNIRGVSFGVPIPVSYPVGDASIKITYKDKNKKNILVVDKAIKIVSSGSGGGGGGGGGDSSSSSSSGSSETDIVDFNNVTLSSTPTPVSKPSSTPQVTTDKNTNPVLISH